LCQRGAHIEVVEIRVDIIAPENWSVVIIRCAGERGGGRLRLSPNQWVYGWQLCVPAISLLSSCKWMADGMSSSSSHSSHDPLFGNQKVHHNESGGRDK
jgi:hypothetical protein